MTITSHATVPTETMGQAMLMRDWQSAVQYVIHTVYLPNQPERERKRERMRRRGKGTRQSERNEKRVKIKTNRK